MPDYAVVVRTTIDRPRSEVWGDVRSIASHVTWMQDAEEIRFLTDQSEGVGTTFECDTKVGPISLMDIMTITEWEDEAVMGVRHVGVVEGVGRFTLTDLSPGQTDFCWEENLYYPWWLGGPLGAFVSRPLLRFVWNGNLRRLKARLEGE